jgi:hypothetical protein
MGPERADPAYSGGMESTGPAIEDGAAVTLGSRIWTLHQRGQWFAPRHDGRYVTGGAPTWLLRVR